MTTPSSLEKLGQLLIALARIDPNMTISALQALISVATAEDPVAGISPGDLKAQGYSPAAATRNLQYWGDRLRTEIDPRDRRFRRVTLTSSGQDLSHFISKTLS